MRWYGISEHAAGITFPVELFDPLPLHLEAFDTKLSPCSSTQWRLAGHCPSQPSGSCRRGSSGGRVVLHHTIIPSITEVRIISSATLDSSIYLMQLSSMFRKSQQGPIWQNHSAIVLNAVNACLFMVLIGVVLVGGVGSVSHRGVLRVGGDP